MDKLIIKNGLVFDPLNNINSEIQDILIESGKIVEKFGNQNDINEIDAKGKTIAPAAIDIHTHVASQQVNWVRLLGTINKEFNNIWQGLTLKKIAQDYISMGYTFILESNVFPSLAKQTIFNFQQIPILDKGMLLNVSNLWPLELEFQRGKINEMAVFLSDLLSKTYGFGFKIYHPFESEAWNFKDLRENITSVGKLYNFSPLDVYENVIKCTEELGLPHSAHCHIEGYENQIGQENLFVLLDKIKSLNIEPNQNNDLKIKRSQILHIAHANMYCFNGENEKLIDFLNKNQNIDINLAFIGFNQINPLITSDRRLINSLFTSDILENPNKFINSAIEFEGDSFASLRNIDKNNFNNCIFWANALELAINTKNKFQVSFSLNFPNYANILDIPEIATWLVSKNARDNFMIGMNKEFLKNNSLQNEEKSLNFSEFVTITRASPAKSLGLGNIKGNLGTDADADINILDININEVDISKNYELLKNALSNIDYVIKSGKIVKKQNKIDFNTQGSIFWSKGIPKTEGKEFILSQKEEFYQKYSSIFYNSYKTTINEHVLRKIE